VVIAQIGVLFGAVRPIANWNENPFYGHNIFYSANKYVNNMQA